MFVLPSFIEGTSHSLLEAMTCGVPIICSDISANRALVTNNKEALLINPDDSCGFRDAIILLSADKSLRNRLGSNGKIIASKYDENIVLPKFLRYN